MSPWAWLIAAGLAEVAWSQSIRPTAGFTRPLPTLLFLLLALCAVYPLTRAMEQIPVGTAYVVFTGIGAAGAVTLGVVVSGDQLTGLRLTGLAFVLIGVFVLQRAS
jgi:quaternary ammonium compound-resistance protein SugE